MSETKKRTKAVPAKIYVNSPAIGDNAYHQQPRAPVIRIDRGGEISEVFGVSIDGPCRVVYSVRRTHDGAHVWIETDSQVTEIPVEATDA